MESNNESENDARIYSLMEDDSNEVNDTRGNEADNGKEQVGEFRECLLCLGNNWL